MARLSLQRARKLDKVGELLVKGVAAVQGVSVCVVVVPEARMARGKKPPVPVPVPEDVIVSVGFTVVRSVGRLVSSSCTTTSSCCSWRVC